MCISYSNLTEGFTMKKIFAILLCVIALFTLAAPAMAASSPTGDQLCNVIVITNPGVRNPAKSYKVGSTIFAEYDPSVGDFDNWTIYRFDGSLAQEGVDYKYLTGDSKLNKISIQVNGDLIVCANYNKQVTDPITGQANKQPDSPQTGYSLALCFSLVMLGVAAVVVSAKKLTVK